MLVLSFIAIRAVLTRPYLYFTYEWLSRRQEKRKKENIGDLSPSAVKIFQNVSGDSRFSFLFVSHMTTPVSSSLLASVAGIAASETDRPQYSTNLDFFPAYFDHLAVGCIKTILITWGRSTVDCLFLWLRVDINYVWQMLVRLQYLHYSYNVCFAISYKKNVTDV